MGSVRDDIKDHKGGLGIRDGCEGSVQSDDSY